MPKHNEIGGEEGIYFLSSESSVFAVLGLCGRDREDRGRREKRLYANLTRAAKRDASTIQRYDEKRIFPGR